jgi:hypothetical protein
MFLRLFVYKVDGCTCEISEVVTGELDWSVGSHYYPSWMAREKGLLFLLNTSKIVQVPVMSESIGCSYGYGSSTFIDQRLNGGGHHSFATVWKESISII